MRKYIYFLYFMFCTVEPKKKKKKIQLILGASDFRFVEPKFRTNSFCVFIKFTYPKAKKFTFEYLTSRFLGLYQPV